MREIPTLYPGSFALVMATGIISNALFFEGRRDMSDALFVVNLVAYPWLHAGHADARRPPHRALWADLDQSAAGILLLHHRRRHRRVRRRAEPARLRARWRSALWLFALALWLA